MATAVINGKAYDWADIELRLEGVGVVTGVTRISWSDEIAVEPIYGKGATPVHYGTGQYRGQVGITLLRTSYDALVDSAAAFGGFFNLPPLVVSVSMKNGDQPLRVVTLPKVKLKSRSADYSAGDTGLAVEIGGELLEPARENLIPGL